MRKVIVLGSILGLFFLFSKHTHAEIINGTAQSTIDVDTNVNGSGTTNTHVETNVNGNSHVYDSNQQGSVHIENNGTSYTEQVQHSSTNTNINSSSNTSSNISNSSTTVTTDPQASESATASPKPTPKAKPSTQSVSLFEEIMKSIKAFFHLS